MFAFLLAATLTLPALPPACPATSISGFFEPYASGILPHEANEGAWNEIKVSIVDNSAGIDSALVDFGVISVPMSDGAFEYCITNYWYVKEGGGVYGQMHPFYTSPMAVTLSANGTLSVEKFGCVATRGTNDITTITRRP